MDLRSGQRRQLTTDMRASCVKWSPDGTRLAVRQGDEIFIMMADMGRVERTIAAGTFAVGQITIDLHLDQGLAWSHDSSGVVFAVYDWLRVVNRIDKVDLRSQRRMQVTSISPELPHPSSMAYSADGKALLFELDSIWNSRIIVYDGVSSRDLIAGWSPVWSPDGKVILFVRDKTLYSLGL